MSPPNRAPAVVSTPSDAREALMVKVQPPYFDALLDGSKPFEVRKNDRAYQRGDRLVLVEWHLARAGYDCYRCRNVYWDPHPTGREVRATATFVYSGDPRFGGIEPGFVVLGLAFDKPDPETSSGAR